jgi:histidinol phosphatase-like enzyme (inositol monophosphatase family)
MSSEPLPLLLEFAVEIARRAGRISLAHFQTGVAVEHKSDLSPVTVADRQAELLIRQLITEKFPDDGIIGEELGPVGQRARRRWLIDPIDGTRTFVRGVPLFGVMVALEIDADAVLGVIHLPALDETIFAARGEGCWWNGRRARVSETATLEHALVLATDVERLEQRSRRSAWDRLRSRVESCRTWGDCYGYALVATGRAEAMIDPVLSVWDAAPVCPIVEEAGGVVTDLDGRPGYGSGHLIATNAALARQMRELIREEE